MNEQIDFILERYCETLKSPSALNPLDSEYFKRLNVVYSLAENLVVELTRPEYKNTKFVSFAYSLKKRIDNCKNLTDYDKEKELLAIDTLLCFFFKDYAEDKREELEKKKVRLSAKELESKYLKEEEKIEDDMKVVEQTLNGLYSSFLKKGPPVDFENMDEYIMYKTFMDMTFEKPKFWTLSTILILLGFILIFIVFVIFLKGMRWL